MAEEKKLVSSGELGKIIGKTARTVQMLAKAGIITCEKVKNKNVYNLYTVVQEYVEHQTNQERKEISSIEEEKTYEEVRFKRAKADMMELELAELDGQLHSAEDVENMTNDLVFGIRSALLALPGRVGIEVAELHTATECSEVIKKAIYEVLEELASYEYDADAYKKLVRERQGWKEQAQEDEDER